MSLWSARSDAAQAVLEDIFWVPRSRLYRAAPGSPLHPLGRWNNATWNMWWQAHALDCVNDAYVRTGEQRYVTRADTLLDGILARTGGSGRNSFFDDMGWLALSLARIEAARPDHPVAGRLARDLLRMIRGGWSDVGGGGVAWASDHPRFKNLPASGPAIQLALRIGTADSDPELVDWGLGLLRWVQDTLVEGDVVWDGATVSADGSISLVRTEYTYNYGLFVGAHVAAWAATRDPFHRVTAERYALVSLDRMSDPVTGVWRNEGGGDGGLFKGVLARNLAAVATAGGPGSATVATAVRRQADLLWATAGAGPIGGDWTASAHSPDLSEHLSGVLLYEQCAAGSRDPGGATPG